MSYAYQWIANDGTTDSDIATATASTYTLADTDVGKTIKIRVSFTDDAGNDDTLVSAATTSVAHPPFTASIEGDPAAHDGATAFTFELRLSEEPKEGFSYTTLRDHAFTVTGGEVTGARRLEPGKNGRWEITVTPGPTPTSPSSCPSPPTVPPTVQFARTATANCPTGWNSPSPVRKRSRVHSSNKTPRPPDGRASAARDQLSH